MKLLATNSHTGDSDATSSFTSGIDSTYKLYIFKYYDINVGTDAQQFMVQFNAAGGADFNETLTTTNFQANHQEDDGAAALGYLAAHDLAQGTTQQELTAQMSNDADMSAAGTLWLFNPSNTTYVKHFYARCSNGSSSAPAALDWFVAGYVNTTAAIDEIEFAAGVGVFDGTIKMYGVG